MEGAFLVQILVGLISRVKFVTNDKIKKLYNYFAAIMPIIAIMTFSKVVHALFLFLLPNCIFINIF